MAHSRTCSATPSIYPPRTYSPANSSLREQHQWSGSLRDTAYNGSEGLIGDSPKQLALAPPPRPASPPKALGARLLSSLSNAQPAAAALTRKGSVLHSRAKSLAAFVPKLNTSATPDRAEKPHVPNKIFGDIFHGESAPIRLGAPVSPTKEKEESEFIMDYNTGFTERPSTFKRRGTSESTRTTAPTQKTSWFSRRPTATSIPKYTPDELANVNINATLFPNGPVDPLNPAAFNDLLLNATNLFNHMQAAYKEKLDYISIIQPEIDAQREEVEEAEIRSKHLKMQLEDMGRQAQEQETAMQDMAQQLSEEKVKVQEAQEAVRTIRLVPRDENRDSDEAQTQTPLRRRRNSGGSASDSGFESDLDSVFSAGTGSGVETPMTAPSIASGQAWNVRQPRGKEAMVGRAGNHATGKRLVDERAAWATVEALRGENQDLRAQRDEMQRTLQGCIDFVSCINGV